MTRVTIPVHGMHCTSCVAKLTAALEALDGVERATVSFEERHAIVDGSADRAAAEATIRALGYRTGMQEQSAAAGAKRRNDVVAAIVLAALVLLAALFLRRVS